jgi:hypothetical protein
LFRVPLANCSGYVLVRMIVPELVIVPLDRYFVELPESISVPELLRSPARLIVPPDHVETPVTVNPPLPVSAPPLRVSATTAATAERLQVPELMTTVSFAVGTPVGFQLPGIDQSCDTDPVHILSCWAMDSVTLTANTAKNKTTIVEFFVMKHLLAF